VEVQERPGRLAGGPHAALFLPSSNVETAAGPSVLLSSPVSEAGDGLVLCDLEGRRVSGKRTIGAGDGWVGAELLARDVGTKHVLKQDVYLTVDWLERAGVWAFAPNWLSKKIFTYTFPRREHWAVGGAGGARQPDRAQPAEAQSNPAD
jgi:hypothetical protein